MNEFDLHPDTQSFIDRKHALLIGDQRPMSQSEQTIAVINPATGEKFTEVSCGSAEDINIAVNTARKTFEDSAWSRMKPVERERLLWRFADLIEANAQSLAEIECLDNGKTVATAGAVDIQLAINFLR